MAQWTCIVCGYRHTGESLPSKCSVCGANSDTFERVLPVETAVASVHHVVIIGAGIAGVTAAETLRKMSETVIIDLISSEEPLPYYRLNLPRYLAGEVKKDALFLHPKEWYDEQKINLFCGTTVEKINRKEKTIHVHNHDPFSYDSCILAMGAEPFISPFVGLTNQVNVTAFRTISDVEKLVTAQQTLQKVVLIGGGILAIEAASALSSHGVEVTIIESAQWILPRQLNRNGGDFLCSVAESQGIHFRTDCSVVCFNGETEAESVELSTGELLVADHFIIATGVCASVELAQDCDLEVDRGVVVDDYLCTSDSSIFAAGDLVQHRGCMYGLWLPAQFMGGIAAKNVLGNLTRFDGVPRSSTLKILGVTLFSMGEISADDERYQWYQSKSDTAYRAILLCDDHVVGAVLLGDTRASTSLRKSIREKQYCTPKEIGHDDVDGLLAILQLPVS